MTGLTTPPIRPFPGPCTAVRSEDPAVYDRAAGAVFSPDDAEAERLCGRLDARLGFNHEAWTALVEHSRFSNDGWSDVSCPEAFHRETAFNPLQAT